MATKISTLRRIEWTVQTATVREEGVRIASPQGDKLTCYLRRVELFSPPDVQDRTFKAAEKLMKLFPGRVDNRGREIITRNCEFNR